MDFLKKGFEEGLNSLGENIGSFFTDLVSNLKNWFKDTADNIKNFNTNVEKWFSDLGKNLKTFFDDLGSDLINLLSYINPLDENFFGYKIVEMFKNLFEDLFVPKKDHFGELNDKINSKFGFIGQLKELVFDLFGFNTEESVQNNASRKSATKVAPPNWTITFYNTTLSIIDWTAFEEYRGVFHSIVIFILWGSFLIRLFKRIPGIIHGFDTNDAK